jgi:hypothetical protein
LPAWPCAIFLDAALSPEEMHFQHPHLSLAEIHAALAYYYENQKQLDAGTSQDQRRPVRKCCARDSMPGEMNDSKIRKW